MDARKTKRMTHAMTIARPPEELFMAWQNPAQLPAILRHLHGRFEEDEAELAHDGASPTFEVVNQVAPALIEWVARVGDTEHYHGVATFRAAPAGRGTEVRFSIVIPNGLGRMQKAVELFRGRDPSFLLREDLRNFKQYMETGEFPTTRGQPSGKRTMKGRALTAMLEERLQRELDKAEPRAVARDGQRTSQPGAVP